MFKIKQDWPRFLRACLSGLLFAVVASVHAASQQSASDGTSNFDGTWGVTLVCSDFKDAGPGAKGYTFRFLAEIRNGRIDAQHGTQGAPGSLHLAGEIQPDGTSEIQADGHTGNPDYSVGRVVSSTPYAYRLRAKFDGNKARATRIDLRPCEATFIKQ